MIGSESVDLILDQAPVQLFHSAEDGGNVFWPWRMNGTHKTHQSLVDQSDYYILDSSFQHEDIRMPDVLDKAATVGADMVALVDIEGSMSETVDSVMESLEVVDDSDFDGELMVPLQPPHDKCYLELEGVGDWYAVGGVAKSPTNEKIDAIESVRRLAGDEEHLHGLGFGVSNSMARYIRDNPDMLDSMDSMSAYQKAMTVHIDETWPAPAESVDSGRQAVVASFAVGYLLERLRQMNPDLSDDPDDIDTNSAAEVTW